MTKDKMAKTKQKVSIPKVNLHLSNIGTKVMVIGMIAMSFVIGMLYQKVQYLEAGNTGTNTLGAATAATTAPAAPAVGTKVSIDQIKALWSKDLVKIGDTNKKVLFVEVGDPSCPYCHAASGLDGELNKQMGSQFTLVKDGGTYVSPVVEMRKLVDSGQASFVYIYYPGHGNGEMGMKSLYCANEQGKFWPVHDLLMSQAGYQIMNGYDQAQQPTKGPIVKNDKTQSGAMATFLKSAIDPTFLKSCLDSGKYDARLGADQAIATSLGVQGTPGFFVNDTNYAGAYSWNDMLATVNAALK